MLAAKTAFGQIVSAITGDRTTLTHRCGGRKLFGIAHDSEADFPPGNQH